MLYLVQIAGFKELALRGLKGVSFEVQLNVEDSEAAGPDVHAFVEKLRGPLQLRSEFDGERITVPIDDLAAELVNESHYLLSWMVRASGSLLVLAHEVTKNALYRDSGPLWEFLRHCRNAASHGGQFNLLHGEPRRVAEWGPFEILASLHGTGLMKDASGEGLLSPGDPIRLLWDIEQAYPDMQ